MPKTLFAAAAAVVGRQHETDGVACQDAVARVMRPGFAAAVLADGAGSAPLAREGAQALAAALAAWWPAAWPNLRHASDAQVRLALLHMTTQALRDAARRHDCAPADLACTLQCCATDGLSLVAAQLGDGRVGVRERATGAWKPLFEPARGEFANETVFVTSAAAGRFLQARRLAMADVDACVLMSDGSEASLFQRASGRFAPALQTLHRWASIGDIAAFEAALGDNLREMLRERTHDDVSLALVLEGRAR